MKRLFTILLLTLSFSVIAQNKAEDVKTFMLKNGMKLMIIEDHSIPTANMYLFFKVGSRNEVPGITGLSHFFEHMMFNGAKKYGFKQFDNVMEAAGGNNNAYTSKNLTVYTDFYPVSAMEAIFDLEADRIQNLAFDSAVVESERGVVYSEYKTGMENSTYQLLNYETNAAAFTAHPYHWSVIGYESDILSWKKKDLEKYFDTYYTPNNCLVVISGAVNTDDVVAMAKQYFEVIPNKGTPPEVRTKEPKQNGERRVNVYKNLSAPHLMMLYHVPEASNEDYYALDILSSLLSSGNSARLNKSLVFDKQLANGIYTDMPVSFDPDVFTIYAVASSNETAEALEQGIYDEIDKIINEPIEAKELQKIKNQKLMEFYQNIETINGRSNSVGNYELFFGDYKKLYEAPDHYNKVTVEDVKRVAKEYLNEDNRTFGIISAKK
jgi:predicted Zn-dependent peptidase